MEIKSCKACGARVVFIRHNVTGNIMCLDAEPNPRGNMHMSSEGLLSSAHAGDPDDHRYMSHHATCPDAEKFRKRRVKE